MTYDLITGFDTVTGHHTGLYGNSKQSLSCDAAIQLLKQKGVPSRKLLIGSAFYGRVWQGVSAENNGLYGTGKFLRGVSYRIVPTLLSKDSGFVYLRDPVAKAPYAYNAQKQWFFTYDDAESIALKTKYCIKQKLNGIMFWQLADDAFENGLLGVIDNILKR
jgi:chitinase